MKRLIIVQARLHHFRVSFYNGLRESLKKKCIELVLIYGQPKKSEMAKNDSSTLAWADMVRNLYVHIVKVEFLWQPYLHLLRRGDVVVVQQENRMLMNYVLLLFRKSLGLKVAFWGHGVNCQASSRNGFRERWKRFFINRPDWWFAYTDFTKSILFDAGFSKSRVTVVNNAIDTSSIQKWKAEILPSDLEKRREELKINSDCVGVYCGSLYPLKRIPFLIESARIIRESLPDFELIIIGDGEDRNIVESATMQYTWCHYVGSQRGRDQVLHLMLAKVFMIPSGVGLAIVDSMVMGLPMVTTNIYGHGPEIAYLKNGENGVVTDDDVSLFSKAVVELLSDADRLSEMSDKCVLLSKEISVERMVDNFTQGVLLLMGDS